MPTRRHGRVPRAARLDPRARRRTILAAAIRVAARRSLAGLSMGEVAQEAGLSKAAVFRYFPERLDLVRAVVDDVERYVWKPLDRARGGTDDPVRILVDNAIAFTAGLETFSDYARIVLANPMLDLEPEVARRIGEIYQRYARTIEDLIREAVRRKLVPVDIDVEMAAWTYAGFAFTVGIARHYGKPPEWIHHLQIALLRTILGHEAVERILSGSRLSALTRG